VAWRPGDAIVRREVVWGRPWLGQPAIVVEDSPALLALYVPSGSELSFPAGDWPGGVHPWSSKSRWQGHGVLQLQRPDEAHAVWVFWHGPERELGCWYVNMQAPFRRTAVGVDTQDHELDIVVAPDGSWRWKDDEHLQGWIEEGRWSDQDVAAIRAEGSRVAAELVAGRRWWDDAWAAWEPDPAWPLPTLPAGWESV